MIAKKHNTCLMFNMVWIFAHSPYLWPKFGFKTPGNITE